MKEWSFSIWLSCITSPLLKWRVIRMNNNSSEQNYIYIFTFVLIFSRSSLFGFSRKLNLHIIYCSTTVKIKRIKFLSYFNSFVWCSLWSHVTEDEAPNKQSKKMARRLLLWMMASGFKRTSKCCLSYKSHKKLHSWRLTTIVKHLKLSIGIPPTWAGSFKSRRPSMISA